jgi:hypothetical protein
VRPKNTICLWFNKDAQDAALFYAATFPESRVTAVHEAPSDVENRYRDDRGRTARLTATRRAGRATLSSASAFTAGSSCRARPARVHATSR